MPPYYYHLKFELYATPDPTTTASGSQAAAPNRDRDDIWVPSPGASIFDDLPSHPRNRQPIPPRWRQWKRGLEQHGSFASGGSSGGATNNSQAAATTSRVIDCGAQRGRTHGTDTDGYVVRLSERQARARAGSSPPPRVADGIGPDKAVRDWRFGRVRIESFDLAASSAGGKEVDAGGDITEMAGKRENGGPGVVMQQATPAASLGPNLGGMGLATKARYVPLETKNTEAGWGIVHLYREGDESSVMRGAQELLGEAGEGGGQEQDGSDDEGTILCIPAVPSYMSPSDFLGFIGERWRGYVSHYRMVMTSRMSRYMVLMKFRDTRRAREWRKEFDGKPFDSVEASFLSLCCVGRLNANFNRPRSAMPPSLSRSRSRRRARPARSESTPKATTTASRRRLPL
jgi:BRCA1-associated protein